MPKGEGGGPAVMETGAAAAVTLKSLLLAKYTTTHLNEKYSEHKYTLIRT
jgi:hypothetical protein